MQTRIDTLGPRLRVAGRALREASARARPAVREASRRSVPALRGLGAPGALLLCLFALCAFAAFSSAGIGSIAEGRVHIAVAVLLVIVGVTWGAGRLHPAPMPLAWAGAAALAGLGLWMLVGVGGSALPDESWIAANRTVAYAAVVAMALLVAGSMRHGPQVAVAGLVAVCALVALYALAGKVAPGLGFDHTSEFPRLRAPIGYANSLGLLLLLPVGAYLWVAADRRFATALRAGALCALVLAIVAAGLTLSRGGLLAGAVIALVAIAAARDPGPRMLVAALAVLASIPPLAFGYSADSLNTLFTPLEERTRDGIVLGALLAVSLIGVIAIARSAWRVERPRELRLGRRGRAVATALAAASILAAGVVATVGPDAQSQVLGTAPERAAEPAGAARLVAGGDSNRVTWWKESLGGWSERPLAGWGGGSFLVVHRLFRDGVVGVRQPHSVPLQFLVETGAIGFLLFAAGLGLLLVAAVRRTLAAREWERSARLALIAAAAGWTAHGFVDWDWDLPGVTLPALVALAVAAAPSRAGPPEPPEPEAPLPPARRLGAPAAAAAVAVALAVSAGMPMLAEGERREALSVAAGAQGDPAELERAAEHAAMARRLNPLSLEAQLASSEIARFRGADADYLGFAVEAARRQPLNVGAWLRLLRVQTDTGDRRFIADTLEAIAATDPAYARAVFAEGLGLLVTPPTLSATAGGTPLGLVEVPPEEDEAPPGDDEAPPGDDEAP